MTKKKILVFPELHPAGRAVLAARDDFDVIDAPFDQDGIMRAIADMDAYVVRNQRVDAALVERGRKLGIIARAGVGLDNLDLPALTSAGIVVCDGGTTNAQAVVEHTFAMMLMLAKQLPAYDRGIREDRWKELRESLAAGELYGKTLLILGLGRVGSRIAGVANALGLHCLGCDIALSDDQIRALGCEPVTEWRERLGDIDIVTVHVPLNAKTRGMIATAELARMKSSALLINCAREGIVDEPALIDALTRGEIAAAGLDVTVREPLPVDDPLVRCERLLLTPHSAAGTDETIGRTAAYCAQNVCDFFDGRLPASHIVNGLKPPRGQQD